jgi:hypothetical protein
MRNVIAERQICIRCHHLEIDKPNVGLTYWICGKKKYFQYIAGESTIENGYVSEWFYHMEIADDCPYVLEHTVSAKV